MFLSYINRPVHLLYTVNIRSHLIIFTMQTPCQLWKKIQKKHIPLKRSYLRFNALLPFTYTVLLKISKTTKSIFPFKIIYLRPLKKNFHFFLDKTFFVDLTYYFYLHTPTYFLKNHLESICTFWKTNLNLYSFNAPFTTSKNFAKTTKKTPFQKKLYFFFFNDSMHLHNKKHLFEKNFYKPLAITSIYANVIMLIPIDTES